MYWLLKTRDLFKHGPSYVLALCPFIILGILLLTRKYNNFIVDSCDLYFVNVLNINIKEKFCDNLCLTNITIFGRFFAIDSPVKFYRLMLYFSMNN